MIQIGLVIRHTHTIFAINAKKLGAGPGLQGKFHVKLNSGPGLHGEIHVKLNRDLDYKGK